MPIEIECSKRYDRKGFALWKACCLCPVRTFLTIFVLARRSMLWQHCQTKLTQLPFILSGTIKRGWRKTGFTFRPNFVLRRCQMKSSGTTCSQSKDDGSFFVRFCLLWNSVSVAAIADFRRTFWLLFFCLTLFCCTSIDCCSSSQWHGSFRHQTGEYLCKPPVVSLFN